MSESWRDDRRKTSERGYGWAWQKARAVFLQHHPLCEMCQAQTPPRVVAATTVDHRVAHRGDAGLFWDRRNWQALCTTHHNSDKQAFEKTGRVMQLVGLDGYPVEPADAPDRLRAPTPAPRA